MNNQEKVWKLLEDLNIVVIYNDELQRQALSTVVEDNNGGSKRIIIINQTLVPLENMPYFLAHEAAHLILNHTHNSIKNESEANRWAIQFLACDIDHIRSYVEFMQLNGIPNRLVDTVKDVITPLVLSRELNVVE